MRRFVVMSLYIGLALTATIRPTWAGENPDRVGDEWCGFSLSVPKPWARAPFSDFTVDGTLRCAWRGGGESSIVVFLQEPGEAVDPQEMLDESVAQQKKDLAVKVIAQEVRTVAGMRAMWMVVQGKGTGGRILGNGEVETVQHWVAVPREKDVVVLLLTCPADDYDQFKKSFGAAVDSLKLSGSQAKSQRGAGEQPNRNPPYVDKDYGFKVVAPSKWKPLDPTNVNVGDSEARRVWLSPDGTAVIVVHVQKPGKPLTARALVDANAATDTAAYGAQVRTQEVRTIGGMQAGFLVYTAKGSGLGVDGKGKVPTAVHLVAVPRGGVIINFDMTTAEKHAAAHLPAFEAMLKTVEVSGAQNDEPKSAKSKIIAVPVPGQPGQLDDLNNMAKLVQDLLELERRIWEGVKNSDPKAMKALLNDEFLEVTESGRRNLQQALESYAEPASFKTYELSEIKLNSLSTNVAVLSYLAKMDGESSAYVCAVYANRGQGWKVAHWQATGLAK